MNDLFRCKGCGAPRSYVNQYCPICESTGPHEIAIKGLVGGKRHNQKAASKSAWPGESHVKEEPYYKTSKTQPKRKKEVIDSSTDDKDIHSVLFDKSSGPKVSSGTWRYVVITVFTLLAVFMIIFHFNNILGVSEKIASSITQFAANLTPHPITDNNTAIAVTDNGLDNNSTGNTSINVEPTPPDDSALDNAGVNFPVTTDTTAPKLIGKPASQVSDTTVAISWETDEESTSLVKYGLGGSESLSSSESAKMVTEHSVFIGGLSPSMTYHFQIISTDAPGNKLTSNDYTFTTESGSPSGPYISGKAPAFTLMKLSNNNGQPEMLSLGESQGKKVILNFWASWCGACKIELPHIQAVWNKYRNGEDVTVLTVVSSDSPKLAIKSYMDENGYDFPVCFDEGDSTFNKYSLNTIPKTFFLDKAGVIRKIQQGMFTSPGEVEFMLNSY